MEKEQKKNTASRAKEAEVVVDDGVISYSDRFFHETNLLRIEGRYFSFARRHTRPITGKEQYLERVHTQDGTIEREISFVYDSDCGKPGITAYKLLQAALKKLSDYGRPVPAAAALDQPELLQLMGRQQKKGYFSGNDSDQLHTAARQLRKTDVVAWWYDKSTGEWAETEFSIINRTMLSGDNNGGRRNVRQLVLYFDPLIVKSLECGHFTCINYSRIDGLPPITVALYKRLFYHFSNIYSRLLKEKYSNEAKRFVFRKDYASVCMEWLGGLTVLKHKSKIVSEQLGAHFASLKETGIVSSIAIEKNKASSGFNILFRPSKLFFDDYAHYYDSQSSIQSTLSENDYSVRQPLELVRFFYCELLGSDNLDEEIFDEKDVEFARTLLAKISFDEAKNFIKFSLGQAKKTNWDIKFFRGCRSYLTEFGARQKEIDKHVVLEVEKRKQAVEKKLQKDYEDFHRQHVKKLREKLSPEKLVALEKEAQENTDWTSISNLPSGMKQRMQSMSVRFAVDKILGDQVPSFEEWKQNHLP